MNNPVSQSVRQQKFGGAAALYLAAAFLVAMPYFLIFVKYADAVTPNEKMAFLINHHGSLRVMYLVTYVIFGLFLAVLALALYSRLKEDSPLLAQSAAIAGLMWAAVLVASGMIFNAGIAAAVEQHSTNPNQATSIWQAVEPVAQGLGGSGGELLGGLWVLLVSMAALHTRKLPKSLNWLGMVTGIAGILSVAPTLKDLAYGFGLLEIVWFLTLGIFLFRDAKPSVGTLAEMRIRVSES